MRRVVGMLVLGLVFVLICAWSLSGWMAPALALPLVLGGAFCT